jgi:cold shock CspA family protein
MATTSTSVTSSSERQRHTGRVKWFNNKTGYGFITVTDGPKAGSDVFVHHSSIKVDANQYKYLVQGEYVEFFLSSVTTGNYEFQTEEISGIKGGKLMCETRYETKMTRNQYRSSSTQETADQPSRPRSVRAPQQRPRDQNQRGEAENWIPAKKPRPTSILKRTASTGQK